MSCGASRTATRQSSPRSGWGAFRGPSRANRSCQYAAVARLKITEIFHSLQGEADTVGVPTTFVRLTGCPLRCQYCDTTYAFHGGEWWEVPAIVARVRGFGTR